MAHSGVNETREVFQALTGAVTVARRVGSDGWQIQDVGLVITDPALMDSLQKAFTGAERIPDELSDLSFAETLELVMAALDGLKQL